MNVKYKKPNKKMEMKIRTEGHERCNLEVRKEWRKDRRTWGRLWGGFGEARHGQNWTLR